MRASRGLRSSQRSALAASLAGALACPEPLPEPGPPNIDPLSTTAAAVHSAPSVDAIDVEPTVPCSGTDAAADLASGCRTQQTVQIDIDHDAHADCVRWVRCGPDEASTAADGSIDYPRDSVSVRTPRAGTVELYSNAELPESEYLDELTVLRVGTEPRLLTLAHGYGTGNVWSWAIQDIIGGSVRRWLEPPLAGVIASQLHENERLGKQYGRGATVTDGSLHLAWLVYRPGDPNCCPTGGLLAVRLRAGRERLEVASVRREPAAP